MSLSNDLAVDSLNFIELIVSLEDRYNFEFDDDFLLNKNADIIGDIIKEILKMEKNNED